MRFEKVKDILQKIGYTLYLVFAIIVMCGGMALLIKSVWGMLTI